MGSMRFTRLNPVEGSILNDFQFDSSPQRAICYGLGRDERNFELRETHDDGKFRHYEVWAGLSQGEGLPPSPAVLVGHLTQEHMEARFARYRRL